MAHIAQSSLQKYLRQPAHGSHRMSKLRRLYKEDVHTYNGVLLITSAYKLVSCSGAADEPSACYTEEVSQNRVKRVHQHMYMESRTMVLMNLGEIELGDSAGEGEGGTI